MKIDTVDTMGRGLAYAEACFETFRVINGKVFGLDKHLQRLADGMAEFGIVLNDSQLAKIAAKAISTASACCDDTLVRVTVAAGDAGWGILNRTDQTQVYIQTMPAVYSKPVTLRLKTWPFPLKKKPAKFTADYAETVRALNSEPDANVLFEKDGVLIAAATANLLLYRQGRWWTPDSDGVLPGVVRAWLLQQRVVTATNCPVDWLAECEAVALINSGSFIRPVAAIEGLAHYDVAHVALTSIQQTIGKCEGVNLK